MADEVEIAKNSLNILSQAFEVASKFVALGKILEIAGQLTSTFPYVGAVLGLIECFLPDVQHEENLRCFEKLSNKIDQVRDDIKELEKTIKWEMTVLQFGDVVSRIELGMKFCVTIGKATAKDEKMRYQKRLKEVCANEHFTLALNALLNGIAGNGLFHKSILDEFYNKTEGDRPKISAFAIRLLQLVSGGIIVLATYETLMRGKEGAEEVTKSYDSQLKEACAKVQSVTDRCVENFKGNMFNDLNAFLDKGGSNKGLLNEVSDFMRDKYDWLENFCLIYNDMDGPKKHAVGGFRVQNLHRNGKCGIVFYRTKGEPPRFSDRYDEAHKISGQIVCPNSWERFKNILAALAEHGIGLIGCAVIRVGYDLRLGGTFSTRYISSTEPSATSIILLQ